MKTLQGRILLLIISGGIAAYKSLDLIRRLKDEGARVRCILTDGGAAFITPLSVTAISGEPVARNLFSVEDEQRFSHIRLSREADLIIVAPASADMIAKMAHGLADTLASTVLLAAPDKPVLIAPAMNTRMWAHPATQENIKTLKARGVFQVGPERGSLACGEAGPGRMSEPVEILDAVKSLLGRTDSLKGKKALVTSGPTFEPLDPVRFLGNRSSGKQGHAIAAALAEQGAEVTLVTGPVALADPADVGVVRVETAREMLAACLARGPFDIAVCAAAVADWRPEKAAKSKIKKGDTTPVVALKENPDILATLAQKGTGRPKLVIGFAAETDDVMKNARAKFNRKGCDWILANDVGNGKGFGRDDNEVVLLRKSGKGKIASEKWPRLDKQELAIKLTEQIALFFNKGKK